MPSNQEIDPTYSTTSGTRMGLDNRRNLFTVHRVRWFSPSAVVLRPSWFLPESSTAVQQSPCRQSSPDESKHRNGRRPTSRIHEWEVGF